MVVKLVKHNNVRPRVGHFVTVFASYFFTCIIIGGFFGYQSGDTGKYAFGGKYYHTVISEPNLILSINAMGALINANDTTGFQANLNIGGEFLFEEFPHVGLSAEAGLGVVSMNTFTFQTSSLSIIKSALHFYF